MYDKDVFYPIQIYSKVQKDLVERTESCLMIPNSVIPFCILSKTFFVISFFIFIVSSPCAMTNALNGKIPKEIPVLFLSIQCFMIEKFYIGTYQHI